MGCDWRELERAAVRSASRLGTARLLPMRRAVAKDVESFMMMARIGYLGYQGIEVEGSIILPERAGRKRVIGRKIRLGAVHEVSSMHFIVLQLVLRV